MLGAFGSHVCVWEACLGGMEFSGFRGLVVLGFWGLGHARAAARLAHSARKHTKIIQKAAAPLAKLRAPSSFHRQFPEARNIKTSFSHLLVEYPGELKVNLWG